MRSIVSAVALSLLVTACGTAPVATVDGTELTTDDLSTLHVDVDRLGEDDLASSILLLLLREAFVSRAAADFELSVDADLAQLRYDERTIRWATPDETELGLARRNERPARIRIEAELDALRDMVGAHLVRTEADGFDIDRAYQAYLIDTARVCVQHIQLAQATDYDEAAARLEQGQAFADVALDLSTDPFVGRQDGGTGAGGDLGCSAPSALPVGMDTAVLDAPVGEAFGPITSTLGAHLIWVIDRRAFELDDVRPTVLEHAVNLQGEELFRVWAVSVLQTMDVDIEAGYGTWGRLPETDPVPTVVPPSRIDQIVSG